MVDMALAVGGVPFEIIFGLCVLVKICFTYQMAVLLGGCQCFAEDLLCICWKHVTGTLCRPSRSCKCFPWCCISSLRWLSIACRDNIDTTSPALGSASAVPAKVVYAVVLPAIKFLYMVAMCAMTHWRVWTLVGHDSCPGVVSHSRILGLFFSFLFSFLFLCPAPDTPLSDKYVPILRTRALR